MIAGALWLGSVALFLAIPRWAPGHHGDATIAVYLLLTAWSLYFWRRSAAGRVSVATIIALGICARVLLIPVAPYTTHDVERYLWDGAVTLAGLDPYVTAPNDPLAASLRAEWPTPEEHGAYPTLYPPLALTAFAASALAGPVGGVFLWKALTGFASVALLLLAADLLRRTNKLQHLPLIALSPLMLLEGGVGAHVDLWAALAITAALWAISRQRWWWAGVAIACGAGIKLLPIVLLGPLLWALPGNRRWQVLGGAGACLGTVYSAALAASFQPVGSLPVFFEKWRFGSPFYNAFEYLGVVSALPLLAALSFAFACWYARRDLTVGLTLALAVPLLFSPVVFPWYLLPLVPLFVIRPSALALAWVTLAPLTYEVLNGFNDGRGWEPASWPLWVLALGWLTALLSDGRWLADRSSSLDRDIVKNAAS